MRVMVLGVRGIPNVQGGVETHAEQLYRRLALLGCRIEVLVRTPFTPAGVKWFESIRLRRLWSPRRPGLEALVHSILGVLYAGISRPDVLHVHAVGPAIITPIARLFGLRVVVTHHGPDYDRDKWGRFARWVLRTGERGGMRYAHARIVISKVIAELVRNKYRVGTDLIPNGVMVGERSNGTGHLQSFGLETGKYFLQVSRMVPEKRQLDLIRAYASLGESGWKLALVGGLDDSTYSREVERAAADAGVVLTGYLSGAPLQQLYMHAGGFILPSSHEGLPIAMLEALSYGLPVLASDIPANLEVGLDQDCYFRLGDSQALAAGLVRLMKQPHDAAVRAARVSWVTRTYAWDRIAEQTLAVYQRALGRSPPSA